MPARATKHDETGLTPGQCRAAALIAGGKSLVDAAAELEVVERTVQRWTNLPEFRRLVGEYRDRLVSETLGVLARSSRTAAAVLAKLLTDDDPRVRLRAAQIIIEETLKVREGTELAARVAELEQRLAENEQGGHSS